MKLISLCPSNTELCAFLGIENLLTAIDDYSDWPLSITSLPRVGPDLSINIDKVEELKPDLVLASLSVPGMEKNVQELEKRKIPHVVLNPQSFDDISKDIELIGRMIGIEKKAKERLEIYNSILSSAKELSESIANKPSIYWEWWPNPIFTPGKINWLSELSDLAGGYNIFQDVDLASVQTNSSDVVKRNPDYICLAWVGVPTRKVNPELIKKRPGWLDIDAVSQNKILVLEEDLYCRPSPRLLEGLIKLAKILHPDIYNSLNTDGLWEFR